MAEKLNQLGPFGVMVSSSDGQMIAPDKLRNLAEQHKLVVLRGFPALDGDALPRFCAGLGEILKWDFGAVNKLQATPDAKNYLYTNREVPFHWDGAFAPRVPGLIFFHCDKAAGAGGGETLFTDTVRLLSVTDRETIDKWRGTVITYTTEKIVHYGGSFTSAMIVPHETREVVRYAEPVADLNPVQLEISGIGSEERDDFFADIHRRLHDPRVCYRHKWISGDILVADNKTLLHGRNAFAEGTDRLIRRVNII